MEGSGMKTPLVGFGLPIALPSPLCVACLHLRRRRSAEQLPVDPLEEGVLLELLVALSAQSLLGLHHQQLLYQILRMLRKRFLDALARARFRVPETADFLCDPWPDR